MREHGCTAFYYIGEILRILLKSTTAADAAGSRLRVGWGIGASAKDFVEFQHRYGVRLRTGYGSTEANVGGLSPARDPDPASVGRALPGYEVRIAQRSTTSRCPPGADGRDPRARSRAVHDHAGLRRRCRGDRRGVARSVVSHRRCRLSRRRGQSLFHGPGARCHARARRERIRVRSRGGGRGSGRACSKWRRSPCRASWAATTSRSWSCATPGVPGVDPARADRPCARRSCRDSPCRATSKWSTRCRRRKQTRSGRTFCARHRSRRRPGIGIGASVKRTRASRMPHQDVSFDTDQGDT